MRFRRQSDSSTRVLCETKEVSESIRAFLQYVDGVITSDYTVPKDVDTEQEGMGKNRENTVQMKILSGTKKTFS